MEFKARIAGAFQGQDSTMFNILSVYRVKDIELDSFKEYRVTITEWKEKRSLDANAYMWTLLSKMAMKLDTSKDELYEDYLQKYGCLDSDCVITTKAKVDMTRIDGHWRYLKTSQDGEWKAYIRIRGTSDYDSKEMATFIQFIVDDAKDLGIETLTPAELERLRYE